MVGREAVYRTALPRGYGVWCGTRTRIVILSGRRHQLCGASAYASLSFRSVVVLNRLGRATGGWASLAVIGNSERERGRNAVMFRFGELVNLAVFPLAKLEWTSTTGKGT